MTGMKILFLFQVVFSQILIFLLQKEREQKRYLERQITILIGQMEELKEIIYDSRNNVRNID